MPHQHSGTIFAVGRHECTAVYRAEGGPVTNINGGVNLSVTASPNPQATAREVINLIRRETRHVVGTD